MTNNVSTWRAVAKFDDRPEQLVFMGQTYGSVRAGVQGAFFEVFEPDERRHVNSLSLQCWIGLTMKGRWEHKATLQVPKTKPINGVANEDK